MFFWLTISIIVVCASIIVCKHTWKISDDGKEIICTKCGIRNCIHKFKIKDIRAKGASWENKTQYIQECENCGKLKRFNV